jgi:predicted transcriptional regulator
MRSVEPRLTQGPRSEIFRLVARVPGAHLRGIERMTGLPLGQVLYHLDRLEKMGLVVSVRDYGFRRYFVTRTVDRREKKFLGALRHEVPRRLVLALLERTGQTHKELQAALGVAGSTLSFHLQRLLASGVVSRARESGSNVYHLSDAPLLARELVAYRASFEDPLVDRFVERVTDGSLPAPPAIDAPIVS